MYIISKRRDWWISTYFPKPIRIVLAWRHEPYKYGSLSGHSSIWCGPLLGSHRSSSIAYSVQTTVAFDIRRWLRSTCVVVDGSGWGSRIGSALRSKVSGVELWLRKPSLEPGVGHCVWGTELYVCRRLETPSARRSVMWFGALGEHSERFTSVPFD